MCLINFIKQSAALIFSLICWCDNFVTYNADDEVEDGEGDDDDDDDYDSTEESDESGDDDEESDDDEAGEDNEDDDDDDDDNDDDSDSDDDFTLPPGPINLIMGGLPIRPQNR